MLVLAAYGIAGALHTRPSVKQTKDSGNVIGGEEKFVCLAFTLEVNSHRIMSSRMPA
jgi:hypothetical protein